MWRVSFLNLATDDIEQKGGFKSDKEACDWICKKEQAHEIIACKLLVWSEMIQCFRTVEDFRS